MTVEHDASPPETVDAFAKRAATWFAETMPPRAERVPSRGDIDRLRHERQLQRTLWDGGFAGICFPQQFGGLGLSAAHQHAFTEVSLPYDMPYSLNVPTLGILAATLAEVGTQEQCAAHLPAILRGDELWVQFLSEPTGGSDLAGVRLRADRDGDEFVLNGSKIWSSGAQHADWAMCLTRTNWDVPKHRGLTMFMVKIHQPGIQVDQIRQVDGSDEFCQEFFDDVRVPRSAVIGEIDEGWQVATLLLGHERAAVGGGSRYTSGRLLLHGDGEPGGDLVTIARAREIANDPIVRGAIAKARIAETVHRQLTEHIVGAMMSGAMSPAAGAFLKLSAATTRMARTEEALDVAGVDGVMWPVDDDSAVRAAGESTLWRQALSLGGGSNEMQRNLIAERVLGMPREATGDHNIAYRDVPHA